MSNYKKLTQHPTTKKWEWADWLDNYFSQRHYGVMFSDGQVFNPEETCLITQEEKGVKECKHCGKPLTKREEKNKICNSCKKLDKNS